MTMFIVDCDRCDYREKSKSYDRACELYDQHHIPTGHRPLIKER